MSEFPWGDFLWGVATGAHQTEGNNVSSDWWGHEHTPGTPISEPSGDAVDAYHHWRDDMDLAAQAGFTDYRFGIEWSRIEPEDGHISRAAVDHYRRMVDGALERGLRPFLTLQHFTLPRWFAHAGGWLNPQAVQRFLRYVEAIGPVLDAGAGLVGTINEPNIAAMFAAHNGQGMSALRDGLPIPDPRATQVLIDVHHATRAHLKSAHPKLAVGWGISVQDCQPEPAAEHLLATYTEPRDQIFLAESARDDWVGVQTYTRVRIAAGPDGQPVEVGDPTARRTMNGWEFYPEALGGALRRAAPLVGDVPIIVTENGIATTDDRERIEYTTRALQSMRDAMDDGIPVSGYLHWSLLDNYEWGSYTPTFGLTAVDRATFTRTPHPSLAWLGRQKPTHLPLFRK